MFGDFLSSLASASAIAASLATLSYSRGTDIPTDLPRPLMESDFIGFDQAKAEIGRLLFYDKILSGNKNISCGTCHHHDLGGSDGLSLGIGEGGRGLGPNRATADGATRIGERIPRNAPALWNLGAEQIRVVFHDGRLRSSDAYASGFDSPVDEYLPEGLDSIIAAQALFPMTARAEMAGDPGENEIADAVAQMPHLAWPLIAERVRQIPEYEQMFLAAFDDLESSDDVTIVEIANAIGAFIGMEWKNFDSPFDRYLNGDRSAMGIQALRGMDLFFGDAGCTACHSGPLMSDQEFHALGLPEFGPGKSAGGIDPGRYVETGALEDMNRFRTPMLRNIALTAPYGHNGAYATLEAIVRHHADPAKSLRNWAIEEAALRPAPWLEDIVAVDTRLDELAASAEIKRVDLTDNEVAQLVAFLESLTVATAQTRPFGRPEVVPSGLNID